MRNKIKAIRGLQIFSCCFYLPRVSHWGEQIDNEMHLPITDLGIDQCRATNQISALPSGGLPGAL